MRGLNDDDELGQDEAEEDAQCDVKGEDDEDLVENAVTEIDGEEDIVGDIDVV